MRRKVIIVISQCTACGRDIGPVKHNRKSAPVFDWGSASGTEPRCYRHHFKTGDRQ